jgi:hypothetical protein
VSQPKLPSAIYKQLQTWFVNLVWPWIVKNIWPELEKIVVAAFILVFATFKDSVVKWFVNLKSPQEQAARKKAAEAEQMAKNSQSEAESEKYAAVAQVWREVAEQFRQENELLQAKLDDAAKKAASDFQNEMDMMEVQDIIEVGAGGSLRLKGSGTLLQLPEPTDKSQLGGRVLP